MSVNFPRGPLGIDLTKIMGWFTPYVFKIDKKIYYSKVVNIKSI